MTAKVTACDLPKGSLLHPRRAPGDFLDCYRVASHTPARAAAEIATAFPGWARALLTLRNIIVRPFGLSTEGPEAGDKLGIFPVEAETPQEVIAGFDDTHLDFRISVLQDQGHVYMATWVHRNNLLGRLYLATILPFHILIIRDALRRVARA